MKIGEYNLEVGDEVLIVEDCRGEDEGMSGQTALFAGMEPIEWEPREDLDLMLVAMLDSLGKGVPGPNEVPVFEFPGGSRIFGCECWWIPKKKAQEIENGVRSETSE